MLQCIQREDKNNGYHVTGGEGGKSAEGRTRMSLSSSSLSRRMSVVQLEDEDLPPSPVRIHLVKVQGSLIIQIEDCGQGLGEEELQKIWSFAYTTADGKGLLQRLASAGGAPGDLRQKSHNTNGQQSSNQEQTSSGKQNDEIPPLAGCGVGLPMSRVHAQSLGGDIFIESAVGIGTSAYMCLTNLQDFRDRALVAPARRRLLP
ncbi:atpase histidine kinase dna gyrase b hsp90 domain-containing protein [Cystoisospora suis]|uniref:Protein-serine/threonine kinase n=1 Tax=Cystoisospora suis TaxID=483139 RepID=A0A2C6KY73_9APIC|nr:atpase histidine kinase dna gyrase b hsp90 domain-containing protein [Cystoisospora suis]